MVDHMVSGWGRTKGQTPRVPLCPLLGQVGMGSRSTSAFLGFPWLLSACVDMVVLPLLLALLLSPPFCPW